MGNTTREARQELAKKGLKPIEEMYDQELCDEGFRQPIYIAPDFSKTKEQRRELADVKSNFNSFEWSSFKCIENSRPELRSTFRPNGTKRTKGEKFLCKVNRILLN